MTSKVGKHKTVTSRFWRWLEPFLTQNPHKTFLSSHSAAARGARELVTCAVCFFFVLLTPKILEASASNVNEH
jgi:hypothetical protein